MKHGRPRFLSQRISFWRVLLSSLTLVTLALATSVAWLVHSVRGDIELSLPSVAELGRDKERRITKILSADGELVATLYREHYKPVKLEDLGDNMRRAVIAIEDKRFYEHDGVDYRGIARAAWGNLRSGSIQEGASTITMQLARKLYLSDERSYERKIKEALLAQKIEDNFGKDEILERYLNEVYFGSGAHGVGSAASRYYGKAPKELSVAESALLAGLIQSPTHLSPLSNLRGARHRQVQVLSAMRDQDFLTSQEHHEALQEAKLEDFNEAAPTAGQPILKYPYFTSFAAKSLVESLGEDTVYDGGLTVTTTLDRQMQSKAQSILQQTLSAQGGRYGVRNGAVVVIENRTGHLKALVGGVDWNTGDRFNRAWQAERQAGSTFKPILYAAALERGATQDTILLDKKKTIQVDQGNGRFTEWTPLNSDGREYGKIAMRDALRLSKNQATVSLLDFVGLPWLIDAAQRFGVESQLPRVPSLALGSGVVTPLEMTETYSTFANQGVYRKSTSVLKVENAQGRVMTDKRHTWSRQATTPEVARQLTDMLARAVQQGTGGAARVAGIDMAGKTGTTDSFRDAWFIGYTPKYTVGVWMGNDDNSPTRYLYGGELPAIVWRKVVATLDHRGERKFPYFNENPTKVLYCKISHRVAQSQCEKTTTVSYYVTPPPTAKCAQCKAVVVKSKSGKKAESKPSKAAELAPIKALEPELEVVDILDLEPDYPVAL